ncbi:uncharacterized protein MELLADRAFT_93988 [Melampsora larici-populina 98AG31]|uniref:Uncharacterized protein n=1 Tax=Melampsora larici-populina (strain 98AG31 / pathotype 3-4-7) TaxID=747676 RepID=F4S602_MELLP|nr:uncharacterized protein MELLADRAFT_93988 [Melampsora larici-populina 98AG31]EGF99849.1 hypothetical protein MELLADRAFT_93988 [Melampsora larici-populina 98AG31]
MASQLHRVIEFSRWLDSSWCLLGSKLRFNKKAFELEKYLNLSFLHSHLGKIPQTLSTRLLQFLIFLTLFLEKTKSNYNNDLTTHAARHSIPSHHSSILYYHTTLTHKTSTPRQNKPNMNSTRSFSSPASQTAVAISPLGKENTPVSSVNGVAGTSHGKNPSNINQPLPRHHSVDRMMSTPPAKPSRTRSSPSSTGLVKGEDETRRRRGNSLARSLPGPFSRLFHLDDKEADNGDGLDFSCCGEAPLRPPRRAGWLGTLEEALPSRAAGKADVAVSGQISQASGALGVLGSPWCPDNSRGQERDLAAATSPFGESLPPLASSGSSPASAEASLASPSYFRGRRIVGGSPDDYVASKETSHTCYSTPPRKNLAKGFGASNAGPAHRLKISIDSISAPILRDVNTSAMNVPKKHK